MSSRILTSHFSGTEEFLQQHAALLAKSTDGTVAVFANNAPAFYALTPARLAQLLELEAGWRAPAATSRLTRSFRGARRGAVAVPMGKFAMYAGWQPDADFQRPAALWGIALSQPVTPKSWPLSSLTGRRKVKSFTTCSGSRSWRVACKSAAPATADSRSAM